MTVLPWNGIKLLSENKSDIILIENIAFNYLLINYFSLDHQVSPPKPHSLIKLITFVIDPTKLPSLIKLITLVNPGNISYFILLQ